MISNFWSSEDPLPYLSYYMSDAKRLHAFVEDGKPRDHEPLQLWVYEAVFSHT